MSADNGIYILKTKDQYRVTHAQAIENIYDSYTLNKFNPLEVVRIWGDCKYTRDINKAIHIAEIMDRKWQTEYGIRIFTFNKTWKHILEDAKNMARIKLENLNFNHDDFWHKRQRKIYEMIINM